MLGFFRQKETWGQRAKHLVISAGHHVVDHVLPHERNDYTPHLLKHRVLLGYGVILVLLKVFVVAVSIALPSTTIYSSAINSVNIISLTNEARLNAGLSPLSNNLQLEEAARRKAKDMLVHQYFAHTSPDGVTPWSWIKGIGYSYKVAGENLAVYFSTAEEVHAGWLASASHRKNILDERFQEIGVGVAHGTYQGYETTFVVQMFGQPVLPVHVATTEPVAEPVEAPVEPKPELPVAEPVEAEETPDPAAEVVVTQPVEDPIAVPVVASEPEEQTSPAFVANVLPKQDAYEIEVAVPEAVEVQAHLQAASAELVSDGAGSWKGEIPIRQELLSQDGESLYVSSTDVRGDTQVHSVALVAPNAQAEQLYSFSPPKAQEPVKLFGFLTVDGLDDHVRLVYLYSILFLGGALMLMVLVKIHVQRHTVVAHALLVMVLALVLGMI